MSLDPLHVFLAEEEGATAIEYALIASLVALAILGGLTQLGQSLDGHFDSMSDAVGSAGS